MSNLTWHSAEWDALCPVPDSPVQQTVQSTGFPHVRWGEETKTTQKGQPLLKVYRIRSLSLLVPMMWVWYTACWQYTHTALFPMPCHGVHDSSSILVVSLMIEAALSRRTGAWGSEWQCEISCTLCNTKQRTNNALVSHCVWTAHSTDSTTNNRCVPWVVRWFGTFCVQDLDAHCGCSSVDEAVLPENRKLAAC